MSQALRPNNFNGLSSLEEQADIQAVKDDEESLAYVARSRGWDLILEEMEQIEKEMDEMVIASMGEADFEEIGKRTLVKELAKNAIQRIKRKVEDAREAADRRAAE